MPNVAGKIGYFVGADNLTYSGALYGSKGTSGLTGGGGGHTQGYINLDASRSNAIYGDSDTVQPPAICLIPQIKF